MLIIARVNVKIGSLPSKIMNIVNSFIENLEALFEEKRNPPQALKNKAYMKNHFEFIGIWTADRRQLTSLLIKSSPLPDLKTVNTLVHTLWQRQEREYHYAGIQTLAYYHKLWQPETIELIEFCLTKHSWWDSVDGLNIDCVGKYFMLFPASTPITTRWNEDSNIWLQRSSIIFQKSYKSKTNRDLLAKHVLNVSESKEFFVRKAIGWALREYAKVNREWVLDFVGNNALSPLSKREALKHLG